MSGKRTETHRKREERAPPARGVRAVVAPVIEPVRRSPPRVAALPEPPHAHLVCRACARILDVPMEFDQHIAFEQLLLRTPPGWMIDSITVSMTGACPRCRQGPAT